MFIENISSSSFLTGMTALLTQGRVAFGNPGFAPAQPIAHCEAPLRERLSLVRPSHVPREALLLKVSAPHLGKLGLLAKKPLVGVAGVRVHHLLLHPRIIIAKVVRVKRLYPAVLDLHLEAHLGVAHEVAVLLPVVADGQGREAARAGADVLDRQSHKRLVLDLCCCLDPADEFWLEDGELVKEVHGLASL